MTDELSLAAEFPPVTEAEWRKLVEAALKGADFDKRLTAAEKNWEAQMQPYRGRKVVTYHRSWPNFAKHFGLNVVGYHAVKHGPGGGSVAYNIGITLLPEHRGRGLGAAAQRLLADYLFAHTRVERVEAGTDVENLAEQRALEKAGFIREGVLRRAQFRDGAFHDMALYSRLRGE